MKKLVVTALLVSAIAACGGKKAANTTPSPTPETKSDATAAPTGGATYGGAAYGTPAK